MSAVRGTMRGIVRFLTGGLAAGVQSEATVTVLSVLEERER